MFLQWNKIPMYAYLTFYLAIYLLCISAKILFPRCCEKTNSKQEFSSVSVLGYEVFVICAMVCSLQRIIKGNTKEGRVWPKKSQEFEGWVRSEISIKIKYTKSPKGHHLLWELISKPKLKYIKD